LRLGIGDDAALCRPRPGYETVLTCDWFLEGTHFLRAKHPPDSVGWKCLARAVSDIAAMGGEPRCFLLSLALPASQTGTWLDGFLAGLRRAQRRLGCALAGGDVTRSERILISVTVVGEIARGVAVRRSGAKPGDTVFVSGWLGEAELGLRRLRTAKRISALLRKHLYPEPRLELGAWLAKSRLASAMMDLSDGLSTDLARLCAASRVGARVEASQMLTVSPQEAGTEAARLKVALHGGDDYELLFTVARSNEHRVPGNFLGVKLTRIGAITTEPGLVVVSEQGLQRSLRPGGWDPFRNG
jgi:thiamine-monophosphate kinase